MVDEILTREQMACWLARPEGYPGRPTDADVFRAYIDLLDLNCVNESGCNNAIRKYKDAAALFAATADEAAKLHAENARLREGLGVIHGGLQVRPDHACEVEEMSLSPGQVKSIVGNLLAGKEWNGT